MPRPLVIGNWKMNLLPSRTRAYLDELIPRLPPADDREIALAPPYTSLPAAAERLRGTPYRLAAQDLAVEDEGPYTGEVSGPMLRDLGVVYAILGHSERRRHAGETDRVVAAKVRAALRTGLDAVVCVGEQENARASGRAASVVRTQLLRAIEAVPKGQAERLVIAYEPVWAIGTGKAATSEDAAEIAAAIRGELERLFGPAAEGVRVLYGGSVSPANIDDFMAAPGISGALVGGASLEAGAFARIAAFHRDGTRT
jgi:triosephosphate isomerase